MDGNWATQLNYEVILLFAEGAEFDNLTGEGELAVAQFEEQSMNPGANCGRVVPPMFMLMPDIKRITLQDDTVQIGGDYDGAERVIHVGLGSHEGAVVSPQGHSIGHWDGDTLVVDTTLFADHRMGNGWGLPSGSQKHLVEYLALNDDGSSINYRFELMDPEFMTAPFTGSTVWRSSPNLDFSVDDCDLESARHFIEN